MTDRELMKQVMENICGAKLCEINSMSSRNEMIRLLDEAITALRDRLAQPEQEPVMFLNNQPLYITPPQRPWVGLTDEELIELSESGLYLWELWKAIEAKLKDKNT